MRSKLLTVTICTAAVALVATQASAYEPQNNSVAKEKQQAEKEDLPLAARDRFQHQTEDLPDRGRMEKGRGLVLVTSKRFRRPTVDLLKLHRGAGRFDDLDAARECVE